MKTTYTAETSYDAALEWFRLITCVYHPDERLSRPALKRAAYCAKRIFDTMHSWVLADPECKRLCTESCLLYQIACMAFSQESEKAFRQADIRFRKAADIYLPGYQNICDTYGQLRDLYANGLQRHGILDKLNLLPLAYRQLSLWYSALEHPPFPLPKLVISYQNQLAAAGVEDGQIKPVWSIMGPNNRPGGPNGTLGSRLRSRKSCWN